VSTVLLDLPAAALALGRGGLVIAPTPSCYALVVDAHNAAAVARVARLKGRAPGNPIATMAADLDQVERLVARWPPGARELAEAHWPAELTLVLPARGGLAPELSAGTGTVGVRVPASKTLLLLAAATGGALTATSANRSGAPPCHAAADLDAALVAAADGVVEGVCGRRLPSTVVSFRDGSPVVLRRGAVAL